MAASLSLSSLLVQETKAKIYATGLAVAEALSLPVTSWNAGDPTRSTFHFLSEILATAEEVIAKYIAAGFLDFAEGTDNAWLILLADQVFGVTAVEATFAETDVELTNSSGAVYTIEAGDLTLENDDGKTYTNTDGGTLNGGGGTLTLHVVADEAGSESSAALNELDMSTELEGVTVTHAAAVGLDAESKESIRQRCRDKLGSFSPNGPRDAYNYVARNSELHGVSVTRSRSVEDSDTGEVTLYIAGASGALSGPEVDDVEEAIVTWATPLCITPIVLSAINRTVDVTYELWIYSSIGKTEDDIEDAIESALETMILNRPLGGDVVGSDPGRLYHSMISSTIRKTFPDHAFRVSVTTPAGDTDCDISEVLVMGTVTATINFVQDP